MGKRNEPLKWKAYIIIHGADPVPMESLTPEQRHQVSVEMAENMRKALQPIYSRHPELFGDCGRVVEE